MIPTVKPALDPLAQRAAIDALEAQRAAYRRYARAVDEQSHAVSGGDADRAVAAADAAARGFDEVDAGARALGPHLDRVREQGSPEQQADVQRRLTTLASDADRAQTAIQNLTAQLDAWRTAYGRQLASVGITPGGTGSTDPAATDGVGDAASGGRASHTTPEMRVRDVHRYGPRGSMTASSATPTLINRLG